MTDGSSRPSAPSAVPALVARLGWIAAALIVALGTAGLVQALDHRPGTAARAELTWAADEALRGPLNAIVKDLDPLALDFDALGAQGRAALAALVAPDPDALDAALQAGQTLVEKIGVETAAVNVRYSALPGVGAGSDSRLSTDLRLRVATVGRALDSTTGIAESWAALSKGAAVATRLARLLSQHDQSSGEAAREGSLGNYAAAVKALDLADPALAEARALRDRLASTTDVSTLTQWIDRNAAIDVALRHLYTVLEASGGNVTEEARQAFADVKAAQQQLPPDTRALVVIMSDIARAGLNQSVIRIEESRGKLADAIKALSHAPGASPTPGADNAGSPQPGSSGQPEITPPDA